MREEEFEGAVKESGKVCIVPIGCVEKHGQHLPVGIDTQVVNQICIEAAKKEPVVVFPPIYFGDVMGHTIVRGGIMFSAELLLQLLKEITSEIARNGFCKILIVNCHGGNVGWLNHFLNAHAYKRKDYATMWAWACDHKNENVTVLYETVKNNPERFSYLTEEDIENLKKLAERGAGGGHGHINETAVVQTVVPHLVNVERSADVDGLSTGRADFLLKEGIAAQFAWPSNYPNAYSGFDSVGSSANIGRAILDVGAERLARIFKKIKEDEDSIAMTMRLAGLK